MREVNPESDIERLNFAVMSGVGVVPRRIVHAHGPEDTIHVYVFQRSLFDVTLAEMTEQLRDDDEPHTTRDVLSALFGWYASGSSCPPGRWFRCSPRIKRGLNVTVVILPAALNV